MDGGRAPSIGTRRATAPRLHRGGLSMRTACALGLICAFSAGCSAMNNSGGSGGSNAPPENTSAPTDALSDPAHPGLDACKANVDSNLLENSLEIASDFKESCHELVVCGGLSASLSTALISVIINAAAGGGASPSGFTFDGKGT